MKHSNFGATPHSNLTWRLKLCNRAYALPHLWHLYADGFPVSVPDLPGAGSLDRSRPVNESCSWLWTMLVLSAPVDELWSCWPQYRSLRRDIAWSVLTRAAVVSYIFERLPLFGVSVFKFVIGFRLLSMLTKALMLSLSKALATSIYLLVSLNPEVGDRNLLLILSGNSASWTSGGELLLEMSSLFNSFDKSSSGLYSFLILFCTENRILFWFWACFRLVSLLELLWELIHSVEMDSCLNPWNLAMYSSSHGFVFQFWFFVDSTVESWALIELVIRSLSVWIDRLISSLEVPSMRPSVDWFVSWRSSAGWISGWLIRSSSGPSGWIERLGSWWTEAGMLWKGCLDFLRADRMEPDGQRRKRLTLEDEMKVFLWALLFFLNFYCYYSSIFLLGLEGNLYFQPLQ